MPKEVWWCHELKTRERHDLQWTQQNHSWFSKGKAFREHELEYELQPCFLGDHNLNCIEQDGSIERNKMQGSMLVSLSKGNIILISKISD
jgi:hypothetical protein